MTDKIQEKLELLFNPNYIDVIYETARKNGAIRTFIYTEYNKEKKVDYVLLDTEYDWTVKIEGPFNLGFSVIRDKLKDLIDLGTKQGITAYFSEKKYFIFSKNVPEEFIPYVMIHEVIESGLIGVGEGAIMDVAYHMGAKSAEKFIEEEMEYAQKYPHMLGCQAELELVFRKGEEFSKKYSEWLLKTNKNPEEPTTIFNQIDLGFLKRNNRLNKNPLEVIVEFYLVLGNYKATENNIKLYSEIFPWIESYLPKKPLEEIL